ncbi:MAG: hypothetical protein LBC82_01275 [Oscillospiraceae bacterium]|jgi:hypothetical protein|nr:hypothetical protein [Oscillospiraceae bacterium]
MKHRNLTEQQIEKIQIDEGVLFLDFGETTERQLAPLRGGTEVTLTATIRDIEFDGKRGKTAGLQVIDEQSAVVKAKSLCCSQEDLALAIPGVVIQEENGKKVLTNPENGIIKPEKYLKNATIFALLIDGSYKKITIFNAMHEGSFNFKAAQKSENEHSLELIAHFKPTDGGEGKLWKIEEIDDIKLVTPTGGN